MKRYIRLNSYKYMDKQNEKNSNRYIPNFINSNYKNGIENSQIIFEKNFKHNKILSQFGKIKNKLIYPLQFELNEKNGNILKYTKPILKKRIKNITNNGIKANIRNKLITKINEPNLKSLYLEKLHYSSNLNVNNEEKTNNKFKEIIKKNINNYIIFSRLHIPTGTYLTLYTSLWGYLLTYDVNKLFLVNHEIYSSEINIDEIKNIIKNLCLFTFGAYNIRTFGCMINDFLDKNYDKHVERTKNRPLADGSITTFKALVYMFIHSSLSLLALFQFSNETIYTGLFSSLFIVTYPLLKRITYYAQLYLSFTFNLGFFIASSVNINILENLFPLIISFIPLCYLTIIYDTIYAHQDKADDIKLKLKSLAIKWDKNTIKYSKILIANMTYLLYMSAYLFDMHYSYYIFTTFNVAYLYYLINHVSIDDKEKCMNFFKKSKNVLFLFFIASLTAKMFEALEKSHDK
ncbi:para-hydroxybenzoate--polyprenyltransferase, putative [Plasmodium berghei]|uniref:4-hydroxybenzoate polyprenyltransferase, putative n=2 Tax=Plasmodium berghei TaxID=5821 RepID=A0A509AE73_PLABA|nr:4-hydroxybenzoate polyprenyltransferase, putative [Plasmodium berghei ANKA]CXH81322.1 para-hydroxybenzoate--polyprenyltransferase, putative [Plasmodium berghei]SCM19115.1 para-hydroxybenzoate--polyprenyltransferase, putative [Plasmodium berghei]SCN21604.1 para-hydroxybenzoate--polyprenyltransferase, putative [Plasmodium berghei]SCO58840.1 para-hydroxybenzoate--polyprenyltransferase, putative [Plasmodium berghei]SCO58897.1 para-hydroxybenzoate--polyprenyltransferase, putative [Plasmodium ber|eukprot:XP_034419660.1 4-hydroxybenzoate polyprenyltransferase, putative [Plasmodium berghei ANKA]